MEWQELQNETLEDLVEYLRLRGDEESDSWAQAAFINITFRYRADLLEKCTVMCEKSSLTETDAEEITNRVFERIYRYPKFQPSGCKVPDIEKCFRFYLYRIARNEFVDFLTPDEAIFTGEEQIITSLYDPDKEYPPEQLKQLKEAQKQLDDLFSRLSPKHKIIFLTYKYHEREGKYLPKRLRMELKNLLNISQSTIRVYKKEVYELAKSLGYGN